MTSLQIKLENGRWTVNGKPYDALDMFEKELLHKFFQANISTNIIRRSNRNRQLQIIASLPKEKIKKSKVFDVRFDNPIPNFLINKN